MPTNIETRDLKVARATKPVRNHPAMRIVGDLSDVADQPPLRTIIGATLVAGALGRNRTLTEAGARMLVSHQLATSIKSAIKATVDRTRPYVVLEGGRYQSRKGSREESRFNSFPSGHSAGAVAVARAIGRNYPAAAVPALAVGVGLAAIQVPRGKHFVSDVVAGVLIGLAADAAVNALITRIERATRPGRGAGQAPRLPE